MPVNKNKTAAAAINKSLTNVLSITSPSYVPNGKSSVEIDPGICDVVALRFDITIVMLLLFLFVQS
jgi:hypothetical protein